MAKTRAEAEALLQVILEHEPTIEAEIVSSGWGWWRTWWVEVDRGGPLPFAYTSLGQYEQAQEALRAGQFLMGYLGSLLFDREK